MLLPAQIHICVVLELVVGFDDESASAATLQQSQQQNLQQYIYVINARFMLLDCFCDVQCTDSGRPCDTSLPDLPLFGLGCLCVLLMHLNLAK